MPPKHPQPLRLPAEPAPAAPANPNCSTEMLAAALLLCRGSFTSALTLSPASRTASLPLNKRVQANPKAPRTRRGARPQPQGRSVVRGARGAGGAAGNLPFCHPPDLPAAPQPGAAGSLISQASPNSHSLRGPLLRQEKTGSSFQALLYGELLFTCSSKFQSGLLPSHPR